MSGTRESGRRSAATCKAKYGDDFFSKIGAKGGRNGHTGGFYANRELARRAGSIAGKVSKAGYRLIERKGRQATYMRHSDGAIVKTTLDL